MVKQLEENISVEIKELEERIENLKSYDGLSGVISAELTKTRILSIKRFLFNVEELEFLYDKICEMQKELYKIHNKNVGFEQYSIDKD